MILGEMEVLSRIIEYKCGRICKLAMESRIEIGMVDNWTIKLGHKAVKHCSEE